MPKIDRELTYTLPETLIRRFPKRMRTYTYYEMERAVRGSDLPNHYRNINGMILPVTSEGEPITD